MPFDFSRCSLINIDTSLQELAQDEITAEVVDAYVCAMSFRNFDFLEKRLSFVLDLKTNAPSTWDKLVEHAKRKYWLKDAGFGILVFDATESCGYVRTYRFASPSWPGHRIYLDQHWTQVADEATLYEMLDTQMSRSIFDAWVEYQSKIVELPTEFVNGRHANTTVAKSIVYSRGEGCVGCGTKASAYAATTLGPTNAPLLAYLPVCEEHLQAAKKHPSVLHFLASIFHLSLDWDGLIKSKSIPDALVPIVHECVAEGLSGTVDLREQRRNGWFLTVPLKSGWHWKLRIRSLTDYSYMLHNLDGTQQYRADSAPHHPEVPFFPNHEHSRPQTNEDVKSPSFLYGHPLLDLKRLKDVGQAYGAYEDACNNEDKD
ncbi:hypothetical protein GTP56_22760 [Duganella sp. FT134W]|uniref:Uncharacterized protein n=1 Tax=Duganella margarita TaxID=2692170 RepID=A0A7X4H491_9BURK|nr:hypothetical protein [Duganella margarita]MYM74996.1 hypothetical protein [Duganella margarita]